MASYSVRYYGTRTGTMCAIPIYNVPANHYIRKFTFYFCDLQLPFDPYKTQGTGVDTGKTPRTDIQGMQWFSKPTSGSQKGYASSNTLSSINGAPKAVQSSSRWTANYPLSWYKKQEYTWEPINGFTGGTLYIGFWSPVNSSTRFGFAATSGIESYFNNVEVISPCKKGNEWRCPVFTYDASDCVPAIQPPTILITDYKEITRYDNNNAYVNWSGSSNAQSTTYLDINGHRVNQNSGDNAGSFTFSPKTYNVGQGTNYETKVYRENAYNGKTIASDSKTMYTYTNPTLSNLSKIIPIINANQTEKFTWNTNIPSWKGKGLETHTLKMTIDGNNVTEINGNTSDIKEINIPNIGKYVRFDSSKINGQEVEVKLKKVHTQDGNVPSAEQTTKITVRRIPTKTVNESSITYKLVDTNGNITSTVLPEDAIVDRKKNGGINVSFTYPSNTSNEHYGIVHGYKLTIFGYKNAKIFEKDYDSTSLSPNFTIDVNRLMWSSSNKIRIQAYYKHSDTNYNPQVDNKIYCGPYIEKTFPTIITRLDTPKIDYPAENSSWINNNFRVLFQLPNDGDFDLYPDEIANNYIYRDIQLKVTSGNTSVTYSWTANPTIFSVDKTTYKAKVAINPSLMNNFPIGNSYILKIRVRKNYGYPDSNKYAEDSWSDWSNERHITIKTHSLFVNQGDYIMATDYEKMYNMILAMRNTYPTYNLKCHLVKKGDYILASDFNLVYQDIWSCFNTVNNWGKYGTTKSKVKFNEGINLPSFSSTVGEYVTDLEDDTSPAGRNYMIKMISDANLLK